MNDRKQLQSMRAIDPGNRYLVDISVAPNAFGDDPRCSLCNLRDNDPGLRIEDSNLPGSHIWLCKSCARHIADAADKLPQNAR